MSSFRQTDHPILKKIPLAKIKEYVAPEGKVLPDRVVEIHQKIQDREATIKLAEEDPLNHGFNLEHWGHAEDKLKDCLSVMCLGGNRCLAGEQEIYDPVQQKSLRVDEINGDFHVWAYDTVKREVVKAPAERPYLKPPAELFELTLSNGESFRCSAAHRFATPFGWRSLAECEENDYVFHLPTDSTSELSQHEHPSFDACHLRSNLGIYLLEFRQGVQRSIQKAQGFLSDCLACLRLRGEQPQSAEVCVPDASQLRDDVQGYSDYTFCDLDDLGNISPHSRPYLLSVLLSSFCAVLLSVVRFSAFLCRTSLRVSTLRQLSSDDRSSLALYPLRFGASFLRKSTELVLLSILSFLVWASWCMINRHYTTLVKSKSLRVDDVWDFSVPSTYTYMIGGVPQKNSGKTEWGARTIVKAAIENPLSVIVCFAQDEDASIRIQQAAVFRNLPPEYKKKAKTETEYINYKVKTGFSGASLILENGSQILFHKYSQFIANRAKFEGLELGSKTPEWHNVGLWLDEYLEDGDLVETMRFRLATRNSKMILTFTPIDGYTPFVASYLKDVETEITRPAALLNNEEVPLIQMNHKKGCGIVYFHSVLNPFGGYDRIAKELAHSPRDEILTRAYGIPVKSMTTLFPLFNSNVHVKDKRPEISPKTHTVYQVVDPAGKRNYVALWAAVDEKGYVSILKEFPDRDTYGAWAEFGDPKWKFGPASKKSGYNVKGYVDLFKDIEEELGVEVFERIGDSRFFAAEDSDNMDLFSHFAEHGIHFVASDGRQEEFGIAALDEWFHYNPNEEVDHANKPVVSIHSSCGNLIYSIMNYGQNGKKDEPLKDFIDVLRYLRMANAGDGPEHYTNGKLKVIVESGGY